MQPLYRARISGECTRISIDGTILRCRERRYLPARKALCAFCTEKGYTFLKSSCAQILDNMHLALVQPLYRARNSGECTRISIDGTILRCREQRCSPARNALCAFCTEKGYTFLKSSCAQILDNMHLALVQPLYRARICGEYTRISIDGTIQRWRERRYWPACKALCAFCTEKLFTFLNSSYP